MEYLKENGWEGEVGEDDTVLDDDTSDSIEKRSMKRPECSSSR